MKLSLSEIIGQFKASHEALLKSTGRMKPEEAFKGSQWSVADVLVHLDLTKFVDALEDISKGNSERFPKYGTLESSLEQYLSVININYNRIISILSDLEDDLLDQEVTDYNPENDYPALTLRDLLARMSRHELTHANQIDQVILKVRADLA